MMTDAEIQELLGDGIGGEYELGCDAARDEIARGFNAPSAFEILNALSDDWRRGYVEIWKLKRQMDRTRSLLNVGVN